MTRVSLLLSTILCVILVHVGTSYSEPLSNKNLVIDNSDTKYWNLVYHVGKYYGSDPPKPDQIFKFYYHITNGTLEQFTKDYESGTNAEINGLIIKIKSNNNGVIDLMMPINYPASNSKSTDPILHMLVNNHDTKFTNKTSDCFSEYSIPFSGNSTIRTLFDAMLETSAYPYTSKSVLMDCIGKTLYQQNIDPRISPLQQINAGVDPKNVQCVIGLVTVLHPTNNMPSCVKPETSKILIERGWAKPIL